MSTAVFPTFPGLAWNVQRIPVWSTQIKTSASGREFRSQLYQFPRWRYKLVYEVLRQKPSLPEMQQMAGFYNNRSGAFDSWHFLDPDDNSASAQNIGTGNGVTTAFQLVRAFSYVEPVYAIVNTAAVVITLNGVTQSPAGYSINGTTGVITFTSPPPSGAVIRWTGNFYWRCRFYNDELTFNQFMKNFWELKSLEFITIKP